MFFENPVAYEIKSFENAPLWVEVQSNRKWTQGQVPQTFF